MTTSNNVMHMVPPAHRVPAPKVPDANSFARGLCVDSDRFKLAMRRLAGAVSVIATRSGEEQHGLTATAVTSLSAEPPRLLVCTNLRGRTFQLLSESRRMSVNVLAQEHEELAKRFAGMLGQGDPFEGERWRTLATGVPVLQGALAAFDCVIEEMVVLHTHAILIGEVKDVITAPGVADPLVYMDGRFGTVARPE